MLAQSFLYLSNKKYATSLMNLDSLMEEVSSFYSQSETKRKVVVVDGLTAPIMQGQVVDQAVSIVKKFNPSIDDSQDAIDSLLTFKSVEEVSTSEYLLNSDKEFLIFVDEADLYTTYFKFIDSVFSSVDGYDKDVLKDFALKVLRRDIDFSMTDFLDDEYIINIIDDMWTTRFPTLVHPSSKLFSYDLLFYMNDWMPDNTVSLPLLKEKFSIHSEKLVHEMIQQMAIKTSFVSPIVGILTYLSSIGDTTYDRKSFIQGVWQNKNRTQALYLLHGFIKYVGSVDGLVDKLKAHPSWEYYEVYRELERSLPLSVAFLEGGFDALNGEEIRDQWAEIEFLYRRRARIPYLLWAVKPLT